MLKQCLINVDFSRLHAKQQSRPKCGEIFYESDNEYCSFQLVCCLCEMKHFAFDDFSMHIRNVHFDKHGKPRTATQQTVNTHPEPEQQLQFISSTSQSVLEGITKNDNEFLSDEAEDESDEDVDIADALDKKALRICAFNNVKSEPEPVNNESTHFECSSQSEDEQDADCRTTAGQEFSDAEAEADDAESDLETQSVFQVK